MPVQRKVITVIDDDPTMLKAIERLLRAKGFDVETFASAEAFLATSSKAACLVLDINLGGMSGIELRRQMTASGSEPPPTIFITALDDEAAHKEAMEAGCLAYLRKPFLASLLVGAINKATA
jgi:FixJ family two-component response regulator